jgi:multidrug resistance efflux pump
VVATTALAARQQIASDLGTSPFALLTDAYPGIVRPRDVTTIALPVPLTIQEVHVSVGDRVTAGQTLLTVDDVDGRREMQQLRFETERAGQLVALLEQAVAEFDGVIGTLSNALARTSAELAVAQRDADAIPVRQWKDSPERAQTAYDQALARERRLLDLMSNGVVSRQDLEDAQFARRTAADDLMNARRAAEAAVNLASLQTAHVRTQADLAIAEQRRKRAEKAGELAQARLRQAEIEAALERAAARLADTTVRATEDMVVAAVSVKAGDRVLAATPLVKLATIDPMIVDIDVPSSVVNAVRRGGEVDIYLDAGERPIRGRIRTVAPLPGDAGAHGLEAEFANLSGALLAGQSASVRFAVTH